MKITEVLKSGVDNDYDAYWLPLEIAAKESQLIDFEQEISEWENARSIASETS